MKYTVGLNPFTKTAGPFWGHITWSLTGLSLKWDCIVVKGLKPLCNNQRGGKLSIKKKVAITASAMCVLREIGGGDDTSGVSEVRWLMRGVARQRARAA